MPKSIKPKTNLEIEGALASLPDPYRAGLPAKDSVVGITLPTAGAGYMIIHTNEIDAYETGEPKAGSRAAKQVAASTGDDYSGSSRRAAKLSISAAKTETFKDVKDLIQTLPAESLMVAHKPPIGTGPTSSRVQEEQRNVHVSAFLYAASKEADNDFHLIVGRDLKAVPELYMTMELSGLPPSNSPSFARLKGARDAFKKFFADHAGGKLPGLTYDFYQPPIPVQIDGSLFFDLTHASGQRPGPPSLKSRMPVVWEIHPITAFVA